MRNHRIFRMEKPSILQSGINHKTLPWFFFFFFVVFPSPSLCGTDGYLFSSHGAASSQWSCRGGVLKKKSVTFTSSSFHYPICYGKRCLLCSFFLFSLQSSSLFTYLTRHLAAAGRGCPALHTPVASIMQLQEIAFGQLNQLTMLAGKS